MSKELLETIDKLDIRVYNTISGRQLIGEVSTDSSSNYIILSVPLEFVKRTNPDTGIVMTVLTSPIIENTSPLVLYTSAIESSSIADIRLKKTYCDQLIYNKIALMEDILAETDNKDQAKSNATEQKGYLDSILDAWKN